MPNRSDGSHTNVEQSLDELDFAALASPADFSLSPAIRERLLSRQFTPSPAAWEDQVLYFLMLDRFSDGKEWGGHGDNNGRPVRRSRLRGRTTPLFDFAADAGNAREREAAWFEAGGRFVGGTLKGLTGKIGYLERLGVTAVWVSPVFRQVSFEQSYHGYGIQNFLDVDPHFGTREDLRTLVQTAHRHGIYIILDIILNHAGNVFAYDPDRYPARDQHGNEYLDPRWDGHPYRVKGFHDRRGQPAIPFAPVDLSRHPDAWPEGAVWPKQLQDPSTFTRKGRISNWDYDPEFLEGDFLSLKDIGHGHGALDDYRPSAALRALCEAYKFWIAYADVDGYRVDTVKHMEPGATRFFTSVIHEFAQSIGKESFYLIGEITGGRERAFETMELTGLDAALGISDEPDKLEYLVKGYRNPREYFDLFRNSELVGKESHTWFRNRIVTLFDDHDQVRKGENKARFCADSFAQDVVLNALALNATTLGIPCIYYGTEQAFDGHGRNDRFLREAMFGGDFGAFMSQGRHFFDEESRIYRELSKLLAIRRQRLPLRRGRQYLREISAPDDGQRFGLPQRIGDEIRSVVPWSRIFNDQEMLLAINTDYWQPRTAWVIVDAGLHTAGDTLRCLYWHSPRPDQEAAQTLTVEDKAGRKAVKLTVPPAGLVIYER